MDNETLVKFFYTFIKVLFGNQLFIHQIKFFPQLN